MVGSEVDTVIWHAELCATGIVLDHCGPAGAEKVCVDVVLTEGVRRHPPGVIR